MKNILIIVSALVFVVGSFCTAFAQDMSAEQKAAILKASQEPLLSMPEPPLGYIATKIPILAGNKLGGFQVVVIKENAVSKVSIMIETRDFAKASIDFSARGARVAACKAYVNALASKLHGAGFKVTDQKLPNIEKETFKKPVTIELTFTKDDGSNLFVRKRVFFTNKRSYDVMVMAAGKDELKTLSQWADRVRPATNNKEEQGKKK